MLSLCWGGAGGGGGYIQLLSITERKRDGVMMNVVDDYFSVISTVALVFPRCFPEHDAVRRIELIANYVVVKDRKCGT